MIRRRRSAWRACSALRRALQIGFFALFLLAPAFDLLRFDLNEAQLWCWAIAGRSASTSSPSIASTPRRWR